MEKFSVQFNYKASYYLLGTFSQEIEQVWFVLHGYGQLAKYFIRKFQSIQNRNTLIVAPEGLSHFYLEGFRGRVGASWMTSEERLVDIENYINYLNKVYEEVFYQLHKKNVKITTLGFSQGVATLVRWITQPHIQSDKIILWSGAFPPDADPKQVEKTFIGKPSYAVYADNDPFISPENLATEEKLLNNYKIEPQKIVFQGKHEIHVPTLLQIANR